MFEKEVLILFVKSFCGCRVIFKGGIVLERFCEFCCFVDIVGFVVPV